MCFCFKLLAFQYHKQTQLLQTIASNSPTTDYKVNEEIKHMLN